MFEPSPASYALATRLLDRCRGLLSALGVGDEAHLDVYTGVIAGLGSQQVANDPGGDRWTRHLEVLLDIVLEHFDPKESA